MQPSVTVPSPPSLQPCAAVASVVAVARGGHHCGRQVVAVLVRPSAVAVDRRIPVAVVKPKSAAASSSSPTSSGHRPSPFRSSIPTFPESPFSQQKNLKSSKASKASHTDPKQPFEHVDPV
uniref:Root cap protein 1-like n=1 Tax=Oryza sativa subsp. japonica TaxID=39947 RepID=Q5Z4L0_ORYSJ|nr:root cap protein 1-like [Oryza sativa Japonica Group]